MLSLPILKWLVIVAVAVILSGIPLIGAENSPSTSGHVRTDGRNRQSPAAHNNSRRLQVATFDFHHVEGQYIVSLWVLLASVAKIGFHLYNKLSSIFPESCLLIVMGVLVGIILYFSEAASSDQYTLGATTFFLFLLPPIVLDAGYFMPARAFFDNIGTILTFAVVNTLFNTLAIGASLYGVSQAGWIGVDLPLLHCLLFSSLIAAVDPVAVLAVFEEIQVNEVLYIIVFGESLLNDAVTVVLYHMLEAYIEIGDAFIQAVDIVAGVGSFVLVAICGTLIGVVFGLLTSFVSKYTDPVRVIEPLFVFVLAYLAYLTAEMVHLSGILAIVFCGIIMRHYVEDNISQKSSTTVKYFMKMLASISETVIFMFLGLSTVVDTHVWNIGFILFTLLFCLVYRAIGVAILSCFLNRRRVIKLSSVDQFVMSYGGLRGAIAFCLVLLLDEAMIPQKRMMVTACIVVVFFTVFLQGITIKPLVNILKVKKADKRLPTMSEQITERMIDHVMAGIEDIAGHYGHHWMRDKFEYYNNKFIRPWLLREQPRTRENQIFEVYTKLSIKEALEYLRNHGSLPTLSHEASLAKVIRNFSGQALSEATAEELAVSGDLQSVLDMAALEPDLSTKMEDSSEMHHLLGANMFRARNKWTHVRKYMLSTDELNSTPFRHNEPRQLRSVIASQQFKALISKDRHERGMSAKPDAAKHALASIVAAVTSGRQLSSTNEPDRDAYDGINFTVHNTANTDSSNMNKSPDSIKTETEKVLSWKRVDERNPSVSNAPSWAGNPAYSGLKETGSPEDCQPKSVKWNSGSMADVVVAMGENSKKKGTRRKLETVTEERNSSTTPCVFGNVLNKTRSADSNIGYESESAKGRTGSHAIAEIVLALNGARHDKSVSAEAENSPNNHGHDQRTGSQFQTFESSGFLASYDNAVDTSDENPRTVITGYNNLDKAVKPTTSTDLHRTESQAERDNTYISLINVRDIDNDDVDVCKVANISKLIVNADDYDTSMSDISASIEENSGAYKQIYKPNVNVTMETSSSSQRQSDTSSIKEHRRKPRAILQTETDQSALSPDVRILISEDCAKGRKSPLAVTRF